MERFVVQKSGITLAKFFCVGILCAATATSLVAMAPRALQDAPKTSAPQTQDQATPPAQTPAEPSKPAATPDTGKAPATQSGQKTTPAPRRRHKKKPVSANCTPTAPAPAEPADGTTPALAAANPPTNCPPTKVIVRQGGTAEQKIQLAGGAGDKASHERDTATQMLSATEQNLKKIAELKLTPSQRDVVTQIRQFMDQSKSATAAGDPSRARTLAWKAQLLSEDLIKPPQ